MLPTRLLLVEASDPVPWTKPEGIPDDPTLPVRLRGLFREGGYRFFRLAADAE